MAVDHLSLKGLKKLPPDSNPDGLAGHLKLRRYALGLTRKAAAKLIGVRGAAITQWETGNHTPESECWPGIIRFLGFDPICPHPKTFPEKIAYVCRHRGISRTALAALIGVDKATILKWERGIQPKRATKQAARLDGLIPEPA